MVAGLHLHRQAGLVVPAPCLQRSRFDCLSPSSALAHPILYDAEAQAKYPEADRPSGFGAGAGLGERRFAAGEAPC